MSGTDIGLKGILAPFLRNDLAGSCGRRVVVETSVKESSVEKEVEVVEEVRKEEVVRSCSSSSVVSGRGGASKESTPSRGGATKKTPRKHRIATNFGGGPLQK